MYLIFCYVCVCVCLRLHSHIVTSFIPNAYTPTPIVFVPNITTNEIENTSQQYNYKVLSLMKFKFSAILFTKPTSIVLSLQR